MVTAVPTAPEALDPRASALRAVEAQGTRCLSPGEEPQLQQAGARTHFSPKGWDFCRETAGSLRTSAEACSTKRCILITQLRRTQRPSSEVLQTQPSFLAQPTSAVKF